MDGIFVPNISFGVPIIKSIRKHTRLPLDVHLMITEPIRYIEDFAKVKLICAKVISRYTKRSTSIYGNIFNKR